MPLRTCSWTSLAAILATWAPATFAVDSQDTLLLADPDISRTHIAFVYDGDVWIANRDGSASHRLTTAEGVEAHPRFSPDGTSLAFSANYDGNVDVYIVPVAGGAPKRLTWHSADDIVEGFDPQGRIIFSSRRDSVTSRDSHLFVVDPAGSFPERLPIPLGSDADVSPDNQRIAYAVMPPGMFQSLTQWKGYRGGSASRVAIMSFADHTVTRVPQPATRSNDLNPMWIGAQLYFSSDRNGEVNLYSFDPSSAQVQQLTHYEDFPVVNASAGDGSIIYEQGGRLHIFTPGSGDVTLHVATSSDLRETRPRRVSDPQYVRNFSGSPDLSRAALEYRGEIVIVPAGKGQAHNLTESPGANDKAPAWSPRGGQIAWISDASGENELYVQAADGKGAARHMPIAGGAGFYRDLKWSPDEKFISFIDNAYTLWLLELQSGRVQKITTSEVYGNTPYVSHNWSPDSQWLAYTENAHGLIQTVYVYSIATRTAHRVTDGLTEVSEPVFDPAGQYLYVLASDEAGPVKDWFALSSLDMTFKHAVYAIALTKAAPSPLPPEGDAPAAKAADEKATASKPASKPAASKATAPAPVRIDFDALADRIVALPTGGATLRNLQVGNSGELYYLWTPATPAIEALNSPGELKRFTLTDRTAKTLVGGVDAYRVSLDGKKVLFQQGKSWKVAPSGGEIKAEAAEALNVGDVSILIDPRQEWRQIAREAWRLQRDYFYATNYHGADWNAVWKKYEPFLDHAATRTDLGRIVSMLASELRVGHSYSTKGETIDKPPHVTIGLLGADYRIDNGRYQFEKVYGGVNWRSDVRAPLRAPGVSVAAGEYLLAVDGKPLTAAQNVYAAFENTVDRPIDITVGPRADGKGARTLRVVPIAREMELRYHDWVESNIRKVDAATQGRVAYVHVPDTSVDGHAAFKRYFYPQSHKEALILDERDNGGGFVADYFIDTLRRQPVIEWAMRQGKDLVTPRGAIFGPKVMLSNEGAGSGGDLLPWMFRKFQLGPIVGTRTWGGLVGNLNIFGLMDGSSITAPNIAGWSPQSGWVIENEGVAPDIEVEESPQSMIEGRDPQLDKAIEVVMQALARQQHAPATRPPYPVRRP